MKDSLPNMDEVVAEVAAELAETIDAHKEDSPKVFDSWLYAQVRLIIEERERDKAEVERLTSKHNLSARLLYRAVEEQEKLESKVDEQDKEIQLYKAALEKIAQGGDKDHVGNVLTLTSSECRMIARKSLEES